MFDLAQIQDVIAAASALGVTSFAFVDATKIGRNGGVSDSGFIFIQSAVQALLPLEVREHAKKLNKPTSVLDILHGHWINGSPLASQKAIAKSLIKLRLSAESAPAVAKATNVDVATLVEVAKKMAAGTDLTSSEVNVLGRFDLALTAILDEGYQRADQRYRNAARVLASVFAVALAIFGGFIQDPHSVYFTTREVWTSIACGLLAIPIAPVSKDLTSALQAGVKVAQAIKR